jgi:hypothetical protein
LKTLIEFTEHSYDRLLGAVEGVTEEELGWVPCPTMNTAGKVIRHAARISLILLPQIVEGTTRGEWDDDYEQREHNLAEMLRDIEAGRVRTLNGIRGLNAKNLETMIPLWGGRHRRVEGINMLVGELVYHAGQIALIHGAYRRSRTR